MYIRRVSKSVQVTIRLPKDVLEAIERLAKGLSRPGFVATRADALRAVIAKGIDAVRRSL
jgi:predicted DNA-binding protein